jgi:sugar phosphate isomerase/epimerase
MNICGIVNLPIVGIKNLNSDLEYYKKFVNSIEIKFDYPFGPLSITRKQIKTIKDMLSSYNFNVILHAPWVFTNLLVPPSKIFNMFLDEIKTSSKIAILLDSELITIHLGNYSVYQNNEVNELVNRAIKSLERISNENSLIISIENMDIKNSFRRGFPLTIDEIMIVYNSDLKLTLDTGHAFLMGENPSKIFSRFNDKILNIHLHDSTKSEAHLSLGSGFFDYKTFIRELERNKYNHYLCLELIKRNDFEKSLNELKKLLH